MVSGRENTKQKLRSRAGGGSGDSVLYDSFSESPQKQFSQRDGDCWGNGTRKARPSPVLQSEQTAGKVGQAGALFPQGVGLG